MFAAYVQHGHRNCCVVGNLLFQCEVRLLYSWSHKIGGERRHLVRDSLSESSGQSAVRRIERATDQRVGIAREDLMIVIVRIVKEEAGVGNAVVGLYD